MKHSIVICSMLISLLAGCSHQTPSVDPQEMVSDAQNMTQTTTGGISGSADIPLVPEFINGSMSSSGHIDGRIYPIIISDNRLFLSGGLEIVIPTETSKREYYLRSPGDGFPRVEALFFTNADFTRNLSVYFSQIPGTATDAPEKDVCHVEYPDGYLSKTERTRTIHGTKIYISNAKLMLSGPDVEPTTIRNTKFCFVYEDVVFHFDASDYSYAYIDHIIDSIRFF